MTIAKHLKLMSFISIIGMISACTGLLPGSDETSKVNKIDENGNVEISAFFGETTKTSLGSDYNVSWCKGDSIYYYSTDNGTLRSHTVAFDAKSTSFIAHTDGKEYFTALYGGRICGSYNKDSIIIDCNVKAVQTGTFKDAHLATSKIDLTKTTNLGFKNLTSIIRFTIDDEDVDHVVFQAMSSTRIHANGKMKISFDGYSPSASFIVDPSTDANGSSVTIQMGGPGTAYLATLPTTIPGFCITAYDAAGKSLGFVSSDKDLVLNSNTIVDLGKIEFGPLYVKPLRFAANSAQTVSMTIASSVNLKYSYDQKTWTDWDGTALPFGTDGNRAVYIIGNNPAKFSEYYNYNQFVFGDSTVPVYASGSVMSLIDPEKEVAAIPFYYCFRKLFCDCTSLVTAPELPATTLMGHCYSEMFMNCISLVTPPELPATKMASSCYLSMFDGCTSLSTAPELPATKLDSYCYNSMFKNCKALRTPPVLPAEQLSDGCYCYMFNGCSSLQYAPELPAKATKQSCYYGMFWYCSSLVLPPELPAETLEVDCYNLMFSSCKALTTMPELKVKTMADRCYSGMFNGCSSLVNVQDTLPAMQLANYCYNQMFSGCSSLTKAPVLPAKIMYEGCYTSMFYQCSNLQQAPELHSTSLAKQCYRYMLSNCNSITKAPDLPATTLKEGCYELMFHNCFGLTHAMDTLPAKTLEKSCYYHMFWVCPELENAPVILGETLAEKCCEEMFYHDDKIVKITAMFLDAPSETTTMNWLFCLKSSGEFIMNKNATWDPDTVRGASGIPIGWEVSKSE